VAIFAINTGAVPRVTTLTTRVGAGAISLAMHLAIEVHLIVKVVTPGSVGTNRLEVGG